MSTVYLFALSTIISFIAFFYVGHKKNEIKSKLYHLVAISVLGGFTGFIFYIMLSLPINILLNISNTEWLILPSTLYMVWRIHGFKFSKNTKKTL